MLFAEMSYTGRLLPINFNRKLPKRTSIAFKMFKKFITDCVSTYWLFLKMRLGREVGEDSFEIFTTVHYHNQGLAILLYSLVLYSHF